MRLTDRAQYFGILANAVDPFQDLAAEIPFVAEVKKIDELPVLFKTELTEFVLGSIPLTVL